MLSKLIYLIKHLNVNTIRFNLRYFPFKQALRMPVFLSNNVLISALDGKVILEGKIATGKIRIGFGNVGIFDKKRSRAIWDVKGRVVFKGHANIGHGSKIAVEGELIVGNNLNITAESSIVCTKRITIKEDCLISWDVLIMDTDYHKLTDESGFRTNPPSEILIGNKVWIGCRTLVLKGSWIPDGCVIGASTLVTGVLEEKQCLYAGNPAKLLKRNINWE